MRSRDPLPEADRAHFITATIAGWLPVFTTPACCDILVRSLEYYHTHRQLRVHAWVIMENHCHAIVTAPAFSNILADWKKMTARELVAQIEREQRQWLLAPLCSEKAAYKKRSQYHVWQGGVHPQTILDDSMMQRKIEFIHQNPVRRGWVAAPEHWRYSSAHEALAGATPVLRCDPWRQ